MPPFVLSTFIARLILCIPDFIVGISLTDLTYPECCVRANDVTILPRADRHGITATFLADLATKLPAVCGGKLQFSPRGMEFTSTLREATQVLGPLFSPSSLLHQSPITLC
jgi:hypothetical protein